MVQSPEFYRIKRLVLALGLSGALNVILGAFILYGMLIERPPTPYCELRPIIDDRLEAVTATPGNALTIRQLRKCTYNELLPHLFNAKLIDSGYTQRDLALACLISFHYFDLHRALGNEVDGLQKRQVVYGKRANGSLAEMTVYPALSNNQWQIIEDFVKRERWPLTPQGLYLLLTRKQIDFDASLADAFTLTNEFQALEALFARASYSVEKLELMQMILEGDWSTLSEFCLQQRQSQNLSESRRQQLLMAYIEMNSKSAAYLLLKTDLPFAVRKLDDVGVLCILKLLNEKSPDSEKYAAMLLKSPRSDQVLQIAAQRIFEYTGNKSLEQSTALMRLPAASERPQIIPEVVKIAATPPPPPKITSISNKDYLYIVQDGDNLWKLSRRFNIDIALLRKHNRLSSDTLKPGTALRIPSSNQSGPNDKRP